MEKLLVKHGTEMNIKVEDAIARAQTPAPMLNPDKENLRQQVFSSSASFDRRPLSTKDHLCSAPFDPRPILSILHF